VDDWTPLYGASEAMSWLELGALELAAGGHTLTLRVNERRTNEEHAYLLYADAFLVTTRDVMPQGLTTPADVAGLKPRPARPTAVPRAAGMGAPMLLATDLMLPIRNHLAKNLEFSLFQSEGDQLSVNQTAPGVWDWSKADTELAEAGRRGVRWQYFPHFTALGCPPVARGLGRHEGSGAGHPCYPESPREGGTPPRGYGASMNTSTLLWGVLFGSFGLGFFIYGKNEKAPIPLACGLALMVYPYFIANTSLMVAIGVALTIIPFVVRL
jgi:hypothetical protein